MKKLFIALFVLVLFVGCSDDIPFGAGSPFLGFNTPSDGSDGASGSDGKDGVDGFNTLFTSIAYEGEGCLGTALTYGLDTNRDDVLDADEIAGGFIVCNGVDGEQGDTGDTGEQGDPGEDGEDGADAPPTEFTIVDILNPCGVQGDGLDEVLLVLANGDVLAHFSHGSRQFLVLLPPGDYSTTDGFDCHFTLNEDGTLSYPEEEADDEEPS